MKGRDDGDCSAIDETARERSEGAPCAGCREQRAHRALHPACRTDLKGEPRIALALVADEVDGPARDIGGVSSVQRALEASDAHHDRAPYDRDTLVLTNVRVSWNSPNAVC